MFPVNIALPTLSVIDLENLTVLGHLELRALFAASFDCVVLKPQVFSMPSSPTTIIRTSHIVCMSVSDGYKAVMPFSLSKRDLTNQLSLSPPEQVPADFSTQSLQSPP